MSSPFTSSRTLIHTRDIKTQAFRRDDGLWDIEATLLDVKDKDFQLASGVKPKGEAIHQMVLTVTIDTKFNVVDAHANMHAAPYDDHCKAIEPDYKKLIGLNLAKGFRGAVKERLSGISGCSHLTELCSVLPTVAIQAFGGEVFKIVDHESGSMPFQLNRCHALRTDGETVKMYHRAWFGAPLTPVDMSKKES
jgi:hypothetical protein